MNIISKLSESSRIEGLLICQPWEMPDNFSLLYNCSTLSNDNQEALMNSSTFKNEHPTRHVALFSTNLLTIGHNELYSQLQTCGEIRIVYPFITAGITIFSFYKVSDAKKAVDLVKTTSGPSYKVCYTKTCVINKPLNERFFLVINSTGSSSLNFMEFISGFGDILSISEAKLSPYTRVINVEYDDERVSFDLYNQFNNVHINGSTIQVLLSENDHFLCTCHKDVLSNVKEPETCKPKSLDWNFLSALSLSDNHTYFSRDPFTTPFPKPTETSGFKNPRDYAHKPFEYKSSSSNSSTFSVQPYDPSKSESSSSNNSFFSTSGPPESTIDAVINSSHAIEKKDSVEPHDAIKKNVIMHDDLISKYATKNNKDEFISSTDAKNKDNFISKGRYIDSHGIYKKENENLIGESSSSHGFIKKDTLNSHGVSAKDSIKSRHNDSIDSLCGVTNDYHIDTLHISTKNDLGVAIKNGSVNPLCVVKNHRIDSLQASVKKYLVNQPYDVVKNDTVDSLCGFVKDDYVDTVKNNSVSPIHSNVEKEYLTADGEALNFANAVKKSCVESFHDSVIKGSIEAGKNEPVNSIHNVVENDLITPLMYGPVKHDSVKSLCAVEKIDSNNSAHGAPNNKSTSTLHVPDKTNSIRLSRDALDNESIKSPHGAATNSLCGYSNNFPIKSCIDTVKKDSVKHNSGSIKNVSVNSLQGVAKKKNISTVHGAVKSNSVSPLHRADKSISVSPLHGAVKENPDSPIQGLVKNSSFDPVHGAVTKHSIMHSNFKKEPFNFANAVKKEPTKPSDLTKKESIRANGSNHSRSEWHSFSGAEDFDEPISKSKRESVDSDATLILAASNSDKTISEPMNKESKMYSSTSKKNTSPAINNLLDIERIISGNDNRTTFMIRNIPNKYTQQMLINFINETHSNEYDFLYLRMDFKNKCNVGYAFINFIKTESVVQFFQAHEGKRWTRFNSEKKLSLAYADIQGKQSLVRKFQNSQVMEQAPEYQPKIFYSCGPRQGKEQLFPKGDGPKNRRH